MKRDGKKREKEEEKKDRKKEARRRRDRSGDVKKERGERRNPKYAST